MAAPDFIRDSANTHKTAEQPAPAQNVSVEAPPQPSESTPEQAPFPVTETEAQFEAAPKKEEEETGALDRAIELLTGKLRKQKKKKPTHIPQVRDALTVEVEQLLSEGLDDVYKELTPIQQQEFKIKGEKTALEIRQLLKGTHVRVKKIFFLIVEWLKLLPGLNRFFLEQEAKIKADKIFALKDRIDS
ncbi:MAG: hypothetical protein COU33_04585 [Candidatus Magasanikbacteria bacterium CG10_big_fil_rev_8_21_14_0_10_43_6]|uniref:Uncharacterized protein n=1 Tax=Candidatus Magasanikbacteria bacterium CG10_big_fil_rev_8_21_14_0_10_43_6 TaxID=1974650 RepID=A0A2M6W098_9BACT|nr:MAG: hypothetical protein COU33_04585 [Candidatus Magasanikbacteria bacterium CG10_big_fil_rev_8_21_14_0_10_43_6]